MAPSWPSAAISAALTHSAAATAQASYSVTNDLPTSFARFMSHARGYLNHSARTVKWHADVFRMFVTFLDENDITVLDIQNAASSIEQWIVSSRTRGISPFTVQTYWRGLRDFFVYLERTEEFPNPFRHLAIPAIPETQPKALSEEDCVRVLDAAQNTEWRDGFERARAAAMIGCALYAGLRRSEVLHLAFSDVNLNDGTIRVVLGKGRGGGKDRTTYAAPELQALLRTYVDARRRAHLTSVEFFTSARGGHGVSEVTFKRLVARVRATAGVPFTLHRLRHSFVTMLLRRNVPIHVVRDLAGHRDIKTTERYTRVFDADKRAHVASLSLAPSALHPSG